MCSRISTSATTGESEASGGGRCRVRDAARGGSECRESRRADHPARQPDCASAGRRRAAPRQTRCAATPMRPLPRVVCATGIERTTLGAGAGRRAKSGRGVGEGERRCRDAARPTGRIAQAPGQSLAAIEQAKAQLARRAPPSPLAQIDLQNTAIRAPRDGEVGQRTVRAGQYVETGMPLLAVVPLDDVYVVANFKETQLGDMQPGPAGRDRCRRVFGAYAARHV